ncbi:pectinesterase family protein [Celeribacter sp.]|uniref:pectinesterase family protein n=1 Tax=Celeribacter sp. TaxID=1890673 RepID=UPI003A8FFE64
MAQGLCLTPQQTAQFRKAEVLAWTGKAGSARYDPWEPMHPPRTLDYIVAANGPFATIQSAVDQAIRAGARPDGAPYVISISEGYYTGPVYIPSSAPPMALIGAGRDVTTLAAGIDAQMSGDQYRARFGAQFDQAVPGTRAIFERIAARETLTTCNTGVLRIEADNVSVSGLTIENLYACDRASVAPKGAEPDAQGRFAQGQHQAVALHIAGADRVHLHALHLRSFQDTLYVQSPLPFSSARTCVEDCIIEGDVDFIFGQATAYFDRCTLMTRGERGAMSWVVAPSTNINTRYGFVFHDCDFTHDGAETGRNGTSFLGRQWFEGVRATPYGPLPHNYACHIGAVSQAQDSSGTISRATLEAVGKAVVIGSRIGAHIDAQNPWDDWGTAGGPRYRPAQASGSDFLHNLAAWLDREGLEYAHIDPSDIWLGIAP